MGKRLKLDQSHFITTNPIEGDTPQEAPEQLPDDSLNVNDNALQDSARAQLLRYCSVLQDCTDNKSKDLMKAVHDILLHDSFDINLFRSELPSITSCRKMATSDFEDKVRQDGFQKKTISFQEGHDVHSGVMFHKDIVACLQKQLSLCSDCDIVFPDSENPSQHSSRKTHPMHTDYFRGKHKELKQKVM